MPVSGTVGQHMQPLASYPHVDADAPLSEVFAMLKEKYETAQRFRSVLVFDQGHHLVGKISLRDLLRALLPDYLRSQPARYEGGAGDPGTLALLWQEDCTEHCRKAAKLRAGDHAQPAAPPLAPEDPLTRALYCFATTDFQAIPVADHGRIVGVLRIVDVLSEVAQAVLDAGEAS